MSEGDNLNLEELDSAAEPEAAAVPEPAVSVPDDSADAPRTAVDLEAVFDVPVIVSAVFRALVNIVDR